jgi:N-acetyl-anhydromuramyl-L-alanine amidase AmpD
MKKRILQVLATLIIGGGSGVIIHNNTGTDITLDNGQVIESKNLTKSLTKSYKNRITDSLFITIHHTAGSKSDNMENIAKFHVEQRGYPEIAYHIAINEDGDIHFLNEISERTYHDSGQNTNSIGIVLVGNYEEYEPSDDMIESVKLITDALCQTIKIRGIRAHRDTSPTLCCGKYAYEALQHVFY